MCIRDRLKRARTLKEKNKALYRFLGTALFLIRVRVLFAADVYKRQEQILVKSYVFVSGLAPAVVALHGALYEYAPALSLIHI